MSFLRHQQIYRPMILQRFAGAALNTAPASSSDESATGYSSASCTPALLASASPAISMVQRVAGTVNTHSAGAGEFSSGEMGNFHPALTSAPNRSCLKGDTGSAVADSTSVQRACSIA